MITPFSSQRSMLSTWIAGSFCDLPESTAEFGFHIDQRNSSFWSNMNLQSKFCWSMSTVNMNLPSNFAGVDPSRGSWTHSALKRKLPIGAGPAMTFFLSLAPLWVNTEGEHCENHQLRADLQMVRTHLVTILDTFRHTTLFFLGILETPTCSKNSAGAAKSRWRGLTTST